MTPRIIFIGTPEHAIPFLESLCVNGYKPIAVITQPDRPRGRTHYVEQTPIKQFAISRGIPVLQPENINASVLVEHIRELNPCLAVVVAYGQILKKEILEIPLHGCINVHFSLLPRHRGASPVQESILDGDAKTGVTIIKMDQGLDTGPILSQTVVDIEPTDTTQSLRKKLIATALPIFIDTVKKIFEGTVKAEQQNETRATYTRRLTRQKGRIDWKKNVQEISRHIRALNPWPGTWTVCAGKRMKILDAHIQSSTHASSLQAGTLILGETELKKAVLKIICADGEIIPEKIQLQGKKVISNQEFLRGYQSLIKMKCE